MVQKLSSSALGFFGNLKTLLVCLPVVSLGFASRRYLCICLAAAHPPGWPWGQNSFGEGRERAGSGTGRPTLQYRLPGERKDISIHVNAVMMHFCNLFSNAKRLENSLKKKSYFKWFQKYSFKISGGKSSSFPYVKTFHLVS